MTVRFRDLKSVKQDDISLKQATKIVHESGGNIDKQVEQLETAPKKNARKPKRERLLIIIEENCPN